MTLAPTLFTDALGEPGSEGATYLDMVRYNVTTIVKALALDRLTVAYPGAVEPAVRAVSLSVPSASASPGCCTRRGRAGSRLDNRRAAGHHSPAHRRIPA